MSPSNILILTVLLIVIFYFFYNRRKKAVDKANTCPKCEGKGHWYGLRHREECKMCDGTGYLS